jgi:hypothetical protein
MCGDLPLSTLTQGAPRVKPGPPGGIGPLNTGSHPLEEGDYEKAHQSRARVRPAGPRASRRVRSRH